MLFLYFNPMLLIALNSFKRQPTKSLNLMLMSEEIIPFQGGFC